MQDTPEIWIVNRHGHEAVPFRQGINRPPGEEFVPKDKYDAVDKKCERFHEALVKLYEYPFESESDQDAVVELIHTALSGARK